MKGEKKDRVALMLNVEYNTGAQLRAWKRWQRGSGRPPSDYASLIEEHAEAEASIERMSPAMGDVLTARWSWIAERELAEELHAYTRRKPNAPDADQALGHLMRLYAGDEFRWTWLDPGTNALLGEVAGDVLERDAAGVTDQALVARALASYSNKENRDKKNRLRPEIVSRIRADLEKVEPRSEVYDVAASGLIFTEAYHGSRETAVAEYRRKLAVYDEVFESEQAEEKKRLLRDLLGRLALTLEGMPLIEMATLDGAKLAADRFEGSVVVYDFWATWCEPCKDQFPYLESIAEKFPEQVVIVSVNMDDLADNEHVRKVIEHDNVPGDYHLAGGFETELAYAFCVQDRIPYTIVFNPAGEVVALNPQGKDLIKAVKQAVRELGQGPRDVAGIR